MISVVAKLCAVVIVSVVKEVVVVVVVVGSSSSITKNDKNAYGTLHKQIRKKCDKAKEKWLNEKCKNMDLCGKTKPHMMYKNTEEIIGRKTCSSTGCLKAKNGNIIMEKDKILERWAEYIHELFDDNR
ncbi:hypothetical protein ElyMa_001024600 [Elysia marginata]|uniref:Secreted protein n=1 Tax=Elysia marginata TaxID=1093978 RepID=A0AAV4HKF5_9GAST|nr:hypothetical protein ElyMa_001024600 [Elysia marginata]